MNGITAVRVAGAVLPVQGSLLTDAETEAIRPGSTRPWNPAAARGYLTGLGEERWHAVRRDDARFARRRARASGRPLEALAACRAVTAVIARRGGYDRLSPLVARRPGRMCAWLLAIETGSTGRELALITPSRAEAGAIARSGADPMLAVRICQAILRSAHDQDDDPDGLDSPVISQLLTLTTRHRPVLYVSEACAEGDCGTRPDETPRCRVRLPGRGRWVRGVHPARRDVGRGMGRHAAARAARPRPVQRPGRPRRPLQRPRPVGPGRARPGAPGHRLARQPGRTAHR
jgi:hypothetical protein